MHFVPAVAYYFCLALPAAFTQPWDHLVAEPCLSHADIASAFALERGRHEKQQSQHRLSFMNKQHFTSSLSLARSNGVCDGDDDARRGEREEDLQKRQCANERCTVPGPADKCLTGNGGKLNTSQAEPVAANSWAVGQFPSISCEVLL